MPVRLIYTFCLISLLSCAAACRQDPDAAARAFVASGDAHVSAGRLEAAVLEYRNALTHKPKWAEPHYKLGLVYDRLRQPENADDAFVRVTELDPGYAHANLRVAAAMLGAGRPQDAERLANRVLDVEPQHVPALAILSEALDGSGQSAAARRRIDEALSIEPRSAAALVALASWHLRRDDVKAAVETLRRASEYNPRSAQAWTALAGAEWRLGDAARTEAALQNVLSLEPHRASARRLLASVYLQSNRAALAEPHLRELAKTNSVDKLALADYYLALDKADAAMPVLEGLTRERDEDIVAQAHLRRAVLARAKGALREARDAVDIAMKQPSAEPQALVLKSELLAEEGDLDSALEGAARAVSLQPGWGNARYALAMVHAARGEVADAERELNRARDRVDAPAAVDMQLARLALARGDANAAVRLARQAATIAPTAAAEALLAHALRAAGNANEARRVLAVARAKWQNSVDLEMELGYLELAARRPDRAREAFERAVRAAPSTATRSGLVLGYVAGGQLAAARASIEAWRSAAPDDGDLAILSAQIDLAKANAARAEQTLADALRHAPRHAQLAETLAQVYLARGDREKALRQYEKVAELRPRSAEAATVVGMLKQEAGDRAGAAAAYERALDISPTAGVPANNLAWLYAEMDRLDDARRMAETAVASLGDSPQALDTLGWVSHRQARSETAMKLLTQAVAKAPQNPVYRYHLALAYASAKKHAAARAELERALSLSNNNFADARRALNALTGPQASRK